MDKSQYLLTVNISGKHTLEEIQVKNSSQQHLLTVNISEKEYTLKEIQKYAKENPNTMFVVSSPFDQIYQMYYKKHKSEEMLIGNPQPINDWFLTERNIEELCNPQYPNIKFKLDLTLFLNRKQKFSKILEQAQRLIEKYENKILFSLDFDPILFKKGNIPSPEKVFKKLKGLNSLDLSGWYKLKDKHLLKLPNLIEKLAIHCGNIGNKGLKNLAQKDIKKLTLFNLPEITDKEFPYLENSKLEELILKNLQNITPKALKHLTSISKLTINNCPKIEFENVKKIPKNIKYFNFTVKKYLSPEKRMEFLKKIATNNPNLTKLTVNFMTLPTRFTPYTYEKEKLNTLRKNPEEEKGRKNSKSEKMRNNILKKWLNQKKLPPLEIILSRKQKHQSQHAKDL